MFKLLLVVVMATGVDVVHVIDHGLTRDDCRAMHRAWVESLPPATHGAESFYFVCDKESGRGAIL